jgi:carbon monoxide dehydrogenase subunit G
MKMDGEKIINAPKQEVWDALNNPEKLKLAIPGAENVEKKDENNLTATVKTKIGPISLQEILFYQILIRQLAIL